MCSIAGLVGVTGIEKMLDAQHHRGPDDSGVFRDAGVELGMGRLKILDLTSPGLCPYTEDQFVLVYNGEIFNYIELRKELRRFGWKFRTSGDTEVLLKCWRQWGYAMFERLNGMYAFALYDKRKKVILLARDIAGEKPLYYYRKGGLFGFASESKAFKNVFELRQRQDDFFDAFQHCNIDTLWQHIHALPAAHYGVYDCRSNRLTIKPHWQFKSRSINLKQASEELEELLEDAVKLRTRSDVPYGLYYSRGMDSALIRNLFPFKHAFYFDDTLNWRRDFFANVRSIVRHLDFPVGSLSSYPLWKLAEQASKKVRVVVSGEGADEMFSGYIRYVPIAREMELQKRYPSYSYLFGKYYPSFLDGFARITARNTNIDFVREQLRPFFEMFSDPVQAMGFADFKLIMPSLLQMGDRMASAFSLENRCPFLDRRIIEFGFSLPSNMKIKGLDQKVILRDILHRRGLIAPLRNEKKGLTIRFNEWFRARDWDRSAYFSLLKKEWRAIHRI